MGSNTATTKLGQNTGDQKLVTGLNNIAPTIPSFVVGGASMPTKDIATQLQARLDTAKAAESARLAWRTAVQGCPCPAVFVPTSGPFIVDNPASTCIAEPDAGVDDSSSVESGAPDVFARGVSANLACEGAVDCDGGQVCCVSDEISTGLQAVCAANCPDDTVGPFAQVQGCKSDSECVNREHCLAQSCNGQDLDLCGLVTVSPFDCRLEE